MTNKAKLIEKELAWFNERYATVENKGDYCIIRVNDGSLYRTDSFKQSLLHMTKMFNGAEYQQADLWLADARRRHYPNGLVFDPTQPPASEWTPKSHASSYNLWAGFSVDPVPGDVEPFLTFMRTLICAGDETVYRWVLAWCADAVQNPASRPGTALVLRGGQGIGKSVFAQTLGRLFGRHFMEISSPEQVTGNFNAHLRDKVLVYSDEGCFLRKRDASVLKNLITSDTLAVHEKFRTPYTVRNCVRLIISGNHERLVAAAVDERRYCIIDVDETRKEDQDYFQELVRWRENGGAEALLHFLLNHRHDINLRRVPRTQALAEHKLNSLTPFERWWLDGLNLGEVLPGVPWQGWHRADHLHAAFAEYAAQRVDRSGQTQFGMLLRKMVPDIRKNRLMIRGQQHHAYQFPPLEDCRRAFTQRFGHAFDWTDDNPADEVQQAHRLWMVGR